MPLGPSWSLRPMASHKVEPLTKSKTRKPPNVPLFDEVEEPDPGPPPRISPEVRDNPHPTDLEEGLLEKLIKYGAGFSQNHVDEDRIYLEQYLHPERDIIPKQPLRPTRGMQGSPDNLEYRRLPEAQVGDKSYPMIDGLGGYTRSGGEKYNSKYDIWDFDTASNVFEGTGGGKSPLASSANWVAKKIMQQVGTPFKVYERYPKQGFEDFSPNVDDDPNDEWDENNEYIPLKKKYGSWSKQSKGKK